MTVIDVSGLVQNESFHIARCCIEDLSAKYGSKIQATVQSMVECEWDRFVEAKKIELKGEMWAFADPVVCFVDGVLLGSHKDLLQWATDEYNYEDFRPPALYAAVASEAYKDYFVNSENTFVFLEISIDGQAAGRLLFELYSQICPKTCENFTCLCTGEKGTLDSGLKLSYTDTPIHRIVPNGWVQGGDILHGRGDGGESVFGDVFEDENFAVPHSTRGILGMANKGRHTNASQFYISLQPTPWMDTQYVAFGALIEGTELLDTIEKIPTYNERPKVDCKVTSCGVFTPS